MEKKPHELSISELNQLGRAAAAEAIAGLRAQGISPATRPANDLGSSEVKPLIKSKEKQAS